MIPLLERRRDAAPNDDLNIYSADRDGAIKIPVDEALDLANRMIKKLTDDQIVNKLISSHVNSIAHGNVDDTDEVSQAEFENHQARLTFIALNFAANTRGLIAPVFRPRLRPITKSKRKSIIDTIYFLDQQLIDLHWLYSRSVEVFSDSRLVVETAHVGNYILWSPSGFFHKDVERFIQLKWTPVIKARYLEFSEEEQVVLAQLKIKSVRDSYNDVMKNEKSANIKVRGYVLKSKQLKITMLDDWCEDLTALKLAKQDVTLATNIKSLMVGKVHTGTQLASAKKTMLRRKNCFIKEKLLIKTL